MTTVKRGNTIDDVVKAVKKPKFGVVIETTNGNAKRYHEKIRNQLVPATNELYSATDKQADFAMVLAFYRKKEFTKKQLKDQKAVNVSIHIKRYNHDLLENVIRKNLDTNYFKPAEAQILAKIAQCSDIEQYFSGSDIELKKHASKFDMSWTEYKKPIKELKGKIMELYTVDIIEHVIADKEIFKRIEYKKEGRGRVKDVDIIVACQKGAFYNAMRILANHQIKEYADTVDVVVQTEKGIK